MGLNQSRLRACREETRLREYDMTYHFPGRPGCACEVCRPHLSNPDFKSDFQAIPSTAETSKGFTAGPPFPPKQAKPPNHYLRKPEAWDGFTSDSGMGAKRFDNTVK